jgi:hypothetical protein
MLLAPPPLPPPLLVAAFGWCLVHGQGTLKKETKSDVSTYLFGYFLIISGFILKISFLWCFLARYADKRQKNAMQKIEENKMTGQFVFSLNFFAKVFDMDFLSILCVWCF